MSMNATTTARTINTRSRAYRAGYRDGLDWDLDGFESREDVRDARLGWDGATLTAMGADACAKAWGVSEGTAAFVRACIEYNAGAHSGACAPQSRRTGLAAGSSRE